MGSLKPCWWGPLHSRAADGRREDACPEMIFSPAAHRAWSRGPRHLLADTSASGGIFLSGFSVLR
jgi:hypothetical protein